jgi:hypothetical protein
MLKAYKTDLPLHKPLRFPLYNTEGILLLKEGAVLDTPEQVDRLLSQGALIGPSGVSQRRVSLGPVSRVPGGRTEAPLSPFESALSWIPKTRRLITLFHGPYSRVVETARLLDGLAHAVAHPTAHPNRTQEVIRALYGLHAEWDAVRAIPALLGTVLALWVAREKRWITTEDEARSLARAGLLRDVGLFQWDAVSARFGSKVPDAMRKIIHNHPALSLQRLQAHGVTDANAWRWVMAHHERPNGGGYPTGAPQEDPVGWALSGGDALASMVLPNGYREAITPERALGVLEKEAAEGMRDRETVQALIAGWGRGLPGTVVHLESGEVGVVVKIGTPLRVFSVIDKEGMERATPVERDVEKPETRIQRQGVPKEVAFLRTRLRALSFSGKDE